MEKISVIIPTHNRSKLLVRAIKSVQEQTYPVDEIIVVSDGSTDDTEVVVNEMSKKDARVKLIAYYPGHNGNYARNKGLEAAKGDYIAFLDDDDEWLSFKIERQMEVFEKNQEIGLVYSGQNCIFSDLNITYQTKPNNQGDLSEKIFFHNDIGTPSQVIVKADLMKKVGNFDLSLGALQDYDLWIRCCQCTKIGFVYDACINYYNKMGNNQVSSKTDKFIQARRYIAEKYSYITDNFSDSVKKEINAVVESQIAQRCLRNGQKADARKYAIASLKIKPSKHAIGLFMASFVSYKQVLKVRSKFNY